MTACPRILPSHHQQESASTQPNYCVPHAVPRRQPAAIRYTTVISTSPQLARHLAGEWTTSCGFRCRLTIITIPQYQTKLKGTPFPALACPHHPLGRLDTYLAVALTPHPKVAAKGKLSVYAV
nr:hypothetical protein CFP56_71015 [Quercus suber]